MFIDRLGITGAKWSNLQPRTQQILEKTLKTMWSQFLPQGVSSALYGLHLLQFRYEDVKYEPSFWTEVDAAMVRCFSAKYASNPVYISQAIANSVYALGMMNVDWSRFSSEGQNAIFDGACLTYPHLTSQEISIIIYG